MTMPPASSSVGEWKTEVASRGDIAIVQVRARRFAQEAGLSRRRQLEFAIAASEAATNLLEHAGSGTIILRAVQSTYVELEAIDRGGGIPDLASALRDGVSRGQTVLGAPRRHGLGLGLGAISRLTDHVHIESSPKGTRLRARKHL
jgi:anti-sigma regulatory factor (Ser/Thr protein kinase)